MGRDHRFDLQKVPGFRNDGPPAQDWPKAKPVGWWTIWRPTIGFAALVAGASGVAVIIQRPASMLGLFMVLGAIAVALALALSDRAGSGKPGR